MKRRQFIKGSAIVGAYTAVPVLLKSAGLNEEKGRKIYQILNTQQTMVGDLPVLRAFAGDKNDYVSPFVFFDEFGPIAVNPNETPLTVGAHPHAGIIPTSYFLSGNCRHRDSLNHDFHVNQGDFMMFTSGRGAIHREETGEMMFQHGGIYHGFQIWLNLPSKYKFIDPTTHVFSKDKMAEIEHKDYTAKIVMGELFGAKSQVETLFSVFYYHIKLKPNTKLSIPTDPTHNAFIYVINGSLEAEGRKEIKANQVVLYERGESMVNIFSAGETEILMLGGRPHNEVVYTYGPFVMNTEDEIRRCIADYNAGKMGDPDIIDAAGRNRL
ncbi:MULTISPECIES: pirin-like C-terminal cupin domain-containing protein [Chryseobacterium]|uniref:Redox-sensitive bicupin YhaK (Pirin superfamily) n=1 Tax=Chryseobacterium geocarposphaerae TaxID=1416776 RepID=A0ABU1LCA9_9FLAO|nr:MULTISPECIES: pirin-like C-terminal cupin domain-containing protein [Chryseobacterium]MDR6404334.1 redox-sensitive bicupin YhaK (pirin superfamily) [Chryseobacterium geocarposphaerae]MDR6700093.1 redox-sensitive bicupin YhaK (pirin superfamily) [Chryseobacterium ginsenosidimutans]